MGSRQGVKGGHSHHIPVAVLRVTQSPHSQHKPSLAMGVPQGHPWGQGHSHRAAPPHPGCRLPSPSISFSLCLTAADAPALQEEGIKLGWRNFKDCCRPEGLRYPCGDGQSCRINPIGSLARLQPVQISRRARGSAGGDAGGSWVSTGASRHRWEINNEKLKPELSLPTAQRWDWKGGGGGRRMLLG